MFCLAVDMSRKKMNESERDNLLIRLDERSAFQHQWNLKHESKHEKEKAARLKWLAPAYAALVGVLVKVIWWD